MSDDLAAFIRAKREVHGLHSWEGQRWQYDQVGPPSEIVYRQWNEGFVVDCLLYYNDRGFLGGILNHYPHGATGHSPFLNATVTEEPGNVNVTVPEGDPFDARPKLLDECWRRWRRKETPWRPVVHDEIDGSRRQGL